MFTQRALFLALLVTVCALVGSSLTANVFADVTVYAADGRELTGVVDDQTDDHLLWLRQEESQIMLTTSIPWSSVIAADSDGESIRPDELQKALVGKATAEPFGFLAEQAIYEVDPNCESGCPVQQTTNPVARPTMPRIRSLDIEAFLVNLDRDVEPDGIEIAIAALDMHGQPVPVKGSLYVRLWGERIQPHGSLVRYETLENWTQPVVPVDFSTDGVASYAFRFRSTQPEADFGLHADGLVNVKLGVFGQGNYEASVPVQIRKFNPVRDRRQLTRGTRFFPGELTQEMRRLPPYRTHTRQLRIR